MRRLLSLAVCSFCLLASSGIASRALADNPDFPGYLGVYVVEGNSGMQITSFIRDTPASQLSAAGEINTGDTIVRLAGRNTETLQALRQARNQIPMDKEAKMILRDRRGQSYYVWISRNEAMAAAAAPGSAAPGAPRGAAPADTFRSGGRGTGREGDFRERTFGNQPPSGGRNSDLRDR